MDEPVTPAWEVNLYRVTAWIQTINVFVLLAVLAWVLLR